MCALRGTQSHEAMYTAARGCGAFPVFEMKESMQEYENAASSGTLFREGV